MANSVIDPNTGASLEYRHLIKGPDAKQWQQANMIEINQLTDGRLIKGSTGTKTISFIARSKLPKHKKATYLRVVSNYRPSKADPYRVRWTVGGNKIEYAGDTSTPTANLTTAKLVFNSVVSTPNAEFATGDISDFYLFTNMDESEYMWIPIQFLNPEVMAAYELEDLIIDGRVLAEISKGMYGLPQAGRLAYDQLVLNSRFVAPCYAPRPFFIGGRRFRNQIRRQTARAAFIYLVARTLQNHRRLDRRTLLGYQTELGLQKSHYKSVYAKLRVRSSPQISASSAISTRACTPRLDKTRLRPTTTIRNPAR